MFIMNNSTCNSKSKQNDEFEDDDIFEDSAVMANFDNTFGETSKFSESNMNFTSNDLNVSALCCDEELSGYDKLAGRTWIYPTNYPVRDYQFNIIRASILKNTLVSLPTGLGKTFIAAVIMYNFYRWYPLGKIVFTAPTRPLVDQQIKACHSIIAIPPEDSIEMTGHMQVNKRKAHWQSKRVFFATPQVIYNDIISGICPCEQIRCLVIDEAHRATGNYAYCQIVSKLDDKKHRVYRLLALSATPGSKLKDVINVVKNLHIAHLELRTEDCIDVAPYSHARKINTVVIKPSTVLDTLRHQYVEILDGYARRLKQLNILPSNLGNISKGRIVMLYKEFQKKEPSARHSQHSYIMKDFTYLISLYHGLEVLLQHGSRVFLNFFDEHSNKFWIQTDDRLTALLERLRDDLGINPLALDRSTLPDGTIPEIPKDLCFGHPKFDKLKQLMMEHFTKSQYREKDTRAIVFCEYRESVNLVHCLLLQCRPLIKPQMFVGQGASGKDGKTVVSQKQQLKVMRNFIEGACNVLVATSVGEEGLDVGSVDLIVCFDVPTKSPTRLVQRCGRTGRQREGQVFILVTEGREHQMLIECMRRRDGLNKTILQSKEVDENLYKFNPRMIPRDFMPQCQKMFITVEKPKENNDAIEKVKKVQKDLRNMLLVRSSTSGKQTNKSTGSLLTEDEFNQLYPDGFNNKALLPDAKEYWSMDKDSLKHIQEQTESELKLSRWLEWQRQLQNTVNITHSRESAILSELLQFADDQRFGTQPDTPNIGIGSQDSPKKIILTPQKLILTPQKLTFMSPAKLKQIKKSKKAAVVKSPAKKDGDIRALFSTATKSTKNYTKVLNDLGINNGSVPTRLMSLFVDLTLDSSNKEKQCYICKNVCGCSVLKTLIKPKKPAFLSTLQAPIMPDIDLIDDFDANIILQCAKNIEDDNIFDENVIIDDKPNTSNNFDLELDFLVTNDSIQDIDDKPKNQDVSANKNNFDIGDIEDIFDDSSPEEPTTRENEIIKAPKEQKNVLSFFGLDSVEDIFADDEIDNTPPEQLTDTKNNGVLSETVSIKPDTVLNEEYPLSPSILSGRIKKNPEPASPILCSQSRKFQLSTNKNVHSSTPLSCRKQLIKEPTNNNTITKPENLKGSVVDVSNQSMLTTTQLLQMINKTEENVSALQKLNVSRNEAKNQIISPILQSQRPSTSPILLTHIKRTVSPILTQSSRRSSVNLNNLVTSQTKRTESIIIYDSDSDSDSTQIYNAKEDVQSKSKEYLVREPSASPSHSKAEPNANLNKTTNNCKRKLEMDGNSVASPYFSKKQKLDSQNEKELILQNKLKAFFKNDSINYNCVVSNNYFLQKENKNPQFLDDCIKKDDDVKKNNLSMLQVFKRDSKVDINKSLKKSPKISESSQKRKLEFNDSDNEFVTEAKTNCTSQHTVNVDKQRSTTNHKVRKKKKHNSFLETEAEISDDSHSGDELSDDSVGSIADFICDDVAGQEDMRAVYLKSIKSPIRAGAFKIPELPKKYNREEILSQYVEEDAYEMDSFCVDSNIELTQVNEVSELELAEIVLEQKRKSKKKTTRICSQVSPDMKPKYKPKRRQIDSDSDED